MDKQQNMRWLWWIAGVAAGAAAARSLWRRATYRTFAGQSVVIAGGSRGLGLVLARMFAAEGAKLALIARDEAELQRAADELRARGAEVLVIPADIGERRQVEDAIDEAARQHGGIDVLVNLAGIIQVGPLDHMTLEDFQNAMDVHFWGPLYAMMSALPFMRQQGGGQIVNVSSIGGAVAVPHLAPYVASKFALTGFSDAARAELAAEGISVTTVVPGLMRTGSHVNAQFKGQHEKEYAWFSIFDALPVSSTSAESAARQIVEACRYRSPSLIITPQARLMVVANALFPNLTARLMTLFKRALPGTDPDDGDEIRRGWESQSGWSPSVLTRLADRAVEDNNELRGREPIVEG